jgi:hypothetical protein
MEHQTSAIQTDKAVKPAAPAQAAKGTRKADFIIGVHFASREKSEIKAMFVKFGALGQKNMVHF